MNKSIKIIFIVLICILILGLIFRLLPKHNSIWQPWARLPDHSIMTLIINQHRLTVEVVNTDASREQGLSNRKTIRHDGMLFVYPYPQYATFWMKDMRFDLDMVWIRGHRIINIMPNLPHPKTATEKLLTYTPEKKVDAVLELQAGTAAKLKLQEGDPVQISNR